MTATEKLEITAVDARDFKRLSEVRVETGGHRNLLLIAGKNTAGKSSLMDALTVALGGKDALPPDPVRRGADKAVVTVELDGGRYTITRTVTGRGKDLKTSLRVVGPDGVISAPQTWLDGIVAGRFLDPVAFLALPADRQRQALLALVGVDVAAIDAERKRVYDERTAVNRDIKAALARRAAIGKPPPEVPLGRPPAEIQAEGDKLAALIAEVAARKAIVEQEARALDARRAGLERAKRERERLLREVERIDGEIAAAEAAIAEASAPRSNALGTDVSVYDARRAELRAEYLAANTRISWEAAHRAHQAQVERADADAARLQAEADAKTLALAQIDARKAALLAAAQMPVADLGVTDDGLTLGGVPFGQASQAERLRCSLAIAMRQSPRLRDVWVRDGALLDDDGIELVRTMAEAHDCRVWLEVVGEDEPGAVVFRDGKIVSATGDAPAKPAAVLQLVPSTLPTNPESSTDDEPDLFA
jgi:hypothetical protein